MEYSPRKQVEILHVDDDPDITDLTGTFLERENERISVETAHNAKEGLERVNKEPPDCIVSDYNMPGMDGIEFLRKVRENHPDLPFVLFTGKGSETVASQAISAGVTDYLQKGSGSEQYELLANRIENVVSAHRSRVAAEQRRHRLEQILKTVPGCVVQLDADGQFVFANEHTEDVLGLERDDVAGRTYNDPKWDIQGPDGDPVPDEKLPFRKVRDEEEPIYGERHTIQWPDGTRKLLLVNGAPVFDDQGEFESAVFSLMDITEQQERERKLRSLKNQYETLVESFPDGGVFLFDTDLEYVRAGGEELTEVGLSPEEIEGKTPHDLFPDEIADEIAHYYQRTLDGNGHIFEQEYDGEKYRIRTNPVLSADGTVSYGMSVATNITEEVERREELKRQKERLEEFANVVSHDLRNPLQVAYRRLELIQQECESEYIDDVVHTLDRIDALTKDLLTLARDGDDIGETQPVFLPEVVRDCWQNVATPEAEVVLDCDRTVQADQGRLQQLLENLLGNAIEHGSEDMTVSVGTTEDGFYVADTGPGIPEGDREEVFEAGYSTNEGGTGFGLRIVNQVAEAHGWEVTVTKSDTGGARFKFSDVEFVDR